MSELWPDGKPMKYARTFWVQFSDARDGCYEGTPDEVESRATKDGAVQSIRLLPYPAEPRTNPKTDCPSLCFQPRICQGRGSCPRRIACSE